MRNGKIVKIFNRMETQQSTKEHLRKEEFETVVQFKTEVGCTTPAEKSIVIKTNE